MLSSRACEAFNPTPHLRLGPLDIFRTEPFRQIDSLDRIHRPLEILFIAIRKGGIDAHAPDRKSTRLNSSHSQISYAVFCLKKKKKKKKNRNRLTDARSKYDMLAKAL